MLKKRNDEMWISGRKYGFLMVGFCEHIDHLNAINKIILKSTSERHF